MTYYVFNDVNGHWRWQLVHNSNGKIIASSGEGYWNKADCLHGIELVAGSTGTPIRER